MRVSLSWLKDYVDVKLNLDKLQYALTMAGLEITAVNDIEGDKILEIEVTPNRPDCLSVIGIARELGAATAQEVKLPLTVKKYYMKKGAGKGTAKIEIAEKGLCTRYVGCIIKNVKAGPSPEWLVKRLNALGVRAVNNIVDITNYVLLELGQPMHAFDLDKLEGRKIIVRRAKKNEHIVTIDGVTRQLDPNILVVADAVKPVAIAGIMGGRDTEITASTKNILLESAHFDPVCIRRASRQLSLASESSFRFERDVDFGMILAASIRGQELIKDISGGKLQGKVSDIGGRVEKEREVVLSLNEIKRVLGIEVKASDAKDILGRLNLNPEKKGDRIYTSIPSYRRDIERDIDLIEEIARLYGYDKIGVTIPDFIPHKAYKLEKKQLSLESEIKRLLSSMGLNEIITYSLTSRSRIESLGIDTENAISLQNPLSSQQEVMRPTLLGEMLDVLNRNVNRKNQFLQLFELNKVYLLNKSTNETIEKLNLSIGICGTTQSNWKEKPRNLDFFDLKGMIESLLVYLGIKDYSIEKTVSPVFKDALCAGITVKGKSFGILGQAKPDIAKRFDIKKDVYLCEIFIEDLFPYINLTKAFEQLARFPAVRRDIAILANDNIPALDIYKVIKEAGKDIIKTIEIFDLYKGQQIQQGKKSIAYTIEYRSDDRTLKDEEVNEIHKRIQDALVKKLGAEIR